MTATAAAWEHLSTQPFAMARQVDDKPLCPAWILLCCSSFPPFHQVALYAILTVDTRYTSEGTSQRVVPVFLFCEGRLAEGPPAVTHGSCIKEEKEATMESQPKQLSQLKDCPKCGRSNAADTRYCEGCGANLVNVQARGATPAEKKKGLLGKLFGRSEKAS